MVTRQNLSYDGGRSKTRGFRDGRWLLERLSVAASPTIVILFGGSEGYAGVAASGESPGVWITCISTVTVAESFRFKQTMAQQVSTKRQQGMTILPCSAL